MLCVHLKSLVYRILHVQVSATVIHNHARKLAIHVHITVANYLVNYYTMSCCQTFEKLVNHTPPLPATVDRPADYDTNSTAILDIQQLQIMFSYLCSLAAMYYFQQDDLSCYDCCWRDSITLTMSCLAPGTIGATTVWVKHTCTCTGNDPLSQYVPKIPLPIMTSSGRAVTLSFCWVPISRHSACIL